MSTVVGTLQITLKTSVEQPPDSALMMRPAQGTTDACINNEHCDHVTCSGYSCADGWSSKSSLGGNQCATDIWINNDCCDHGMCGDYSWAGGCSEKPSLAIARGTTDACVNKGVAIMSHAVATSLADGWSFKVESGVNRCVRTFASPLIVVIMACAVVTLVHAVVLQDEAERKADCYGTVAGYWTVAGRTTVGNALISACAKSNPAEAAECQM